MVDPLSPYNHTKHKTQTMSTTVHLINLLQDFCLGWYLQNNMKDPNQGEEKKKMNKTSYKDLEDVKASISGGDIYQY